MSRNAALQEKVLHLSVLVGLGTCHKGWSNLTMSTEVPLTVLTKYLCPVEMDLNEQIQEGALNR